MKASNWQRLFPAAGLLATAGVTAAATHEWWVLGLGVLASGVLALLNREAPPFPPGLDAEHRARARLLWEAKEQLAAELAKVPEAARELLAVSAPQLERIGAQAMTLVARHQELQSFLAQAGGQGLAADRDRLERLARRSEDSAAAERYRDAAKVREGQLAHATALQGQVSRLDAELAELQARLEAVKVQVLTLRSARADSGLVESSQRLTTDLTRLSQDIGVISDSFAEVAGAPRPPQGTRNS